MPRDTLAVLMVDDDEDDFLIVTETCQDIPSRIEVEWASSFAAGRSRLLDGAHDVCLVDFNLGGRSGIQLLEDVRAAGIHTPIVLLTGGGEGDLDLAALRNGAEDYLEKDQLTPVLLERTLRYAIERARTREKLRESEERYALSAQGAKDGIWDWNLKTGEVFYSDRWKKLLGLAPADVGTGADEWMDRIEPSDRGRLQEELQTHLDGVTEHFACEHRMMHHDGSYRWFLARGVAVRDAGGKAYRIAGSQTDVTARREQQEKLLSHVSHELRTPLNAVYQYNSLLHDGVVGPVGEDQKDVLARSLRNIDQLKTMIGDLMESTRIQSGKFAVHPRRVDLQALIVDTLETLRISARNRGIGIEASLSDLPAIYADPARVRQVLINLCDNAMKFTPEGGAVAVRAAGTSDPGFVQITVADTGPGILEEARIAIFERLHQETQSTATSREGLGLGLHICKEIVSRHGGRIWVESEVGAGSQFHFTLPAFQSERILRHRFGVVPAEVPALVMFTVTMERTGTERAGSLHLDEVRTVLERSLIADLDFVLPGIADDEDTSSIRFLSFIDPVHAEPLIARLQSRFRDLPGLRRHGLIPHIHPRELPLPPDYAQLDDDERLKVLARLVDHHLEDKPVPVA